MHALDRSDHMPVITENYLRKVMAPCILLAFPNPALFMAGASNTGKLTGDQPRWNAPGRDHSGIWLRNAAAGLCLLAAAAAVVSFTAPYRLIQATRHLAVVAALEAAIPDAAALVFACLGIALALHGRRVIRARALNLTAVGTSVFMNAIAAAPGWRNLAIWAMPQWPTPWPATPSSAWSAPGPWPATSASAASWPLTRPPPWPSSAA